MSTLWFVLVAATFGAYVLLDGYDLGAGILHPFVARNDAERRVVLDAVAPVWDGNEVFLVAGGATLYLAFPPLFAAFASGFYLPIMIVLWLLALRALGIEMRHKMSHPLWNQLWDGGFFLGSALLVLFFGAALGNVIRGVSVAEDGTFFAPLWTDFWVGTDVGILDWFTLMVGFTAVAVTAHHGATWLAHRARLVEVVTEASTEVGARASVAAKWTLPFAVALATATSAASFGAVPAIGEHVAARPWGSVFPLVALAGAAASFVFARRGEHARAYAGSSSFVAGLFGAACFGIYPYGLPARVAARGVSLEEACAGAHGLSVALLWWVPGMILVIVWLTLTRRVLVRRRT